MGEFGTGKGSNNTVVEKVGRFFYLVNYKTHSYENIQDVPDYVVDAAPFFMAAIFIEILIMVIKGDFHFKIFYAFNNIAAGIVQQLSSLLWRPIHLVVYCWVYENYRIYELPWNSAWTWYLTFLSIDFCYYWLHRSTHEVNLFWCAHQVHHSSEDLNLTTALRQSATQSLCNTLFYTPLAFFIPPSIAFIHLQFNLIYQFWVHTEVVRSIGPLEYILNTASHHRVHHGRNPYCIDKNYGATLIIWDRLFNTFAAEGETIAYGLVHSQQTANPFKLQADHFVAIAKRCWRMKGWKDMFRVLFYRPSWLSEQEKVGLSEEDMKIPEVEQPIVNRELQYFGMENNRLESIYVFCHFFIANIVLQEFFARKMTLTATEVNVVILVFFWMLTSLGYVLENRWFWRLSECSRCLFILLLDLYMYVNSYTNPILPGFFVSIIQLSYVGSIIVLLSMEITKRMNAVCEEKRK